MNPAIATKKSRTKKVSTTVRMDPSFKQKVERYAEKNHMNFSTFLHFSLATTMQNGGEIEPYYEVSDEYAKELDEMEARIARGEEKVYGPFEGKEAIDFLRSCM
jgi:predicted transcriptional regulator